MAEAVSTSLGPDRSDTKQVPSESAVREAIRAEAARAAAAMSAAHPPLRGDLELCADAILKRLSLPTTFRGFAMVAVSNAFWHPQFQSVPFERRLFCLPNCLRNREVCRGEFDSGGALHCAGCGACVIHDLKHAAETLGYRVLIFEGTPPVLAALAEPSADAILGVACLDALDKAFDRASNLGTPNMAVPLLNNGCSNTAVETDLVLALLHAASGKPTERARTYVPLLRESARLFAPDVLSELLAPCVPELDARTETDSIAIEWIAAGGKRFRPFVALAAYAVSRYGADALCPDADLAGAIPDAMRRVALAFEILHKASLVHDDIEDDDAFRYGRETLHRAYGTGPAINIGDYLVGLGYQLIAAQAPELGARCVADILSRLSAAHLDLCRGQGTELLQNNDPQKLLRPIDVLSVYALKTAPAFRIALYAGLRAARAAFDEAAIGNFAIYVGEAYQILNDLEDWRWDRNNKVEAGRDARARRPTILRAFACEAGAVDQLAGVAGDIEKTREIYEAVGAFEKTAALVEKLRHRAVAVAEKAGDTSLRDLLLFLMRTIL